MSIGDARLSLGISMAEVFGTLQGFLGSRYVNDFGMFGRTWQVVVQADREFRDRIEDVQKLQVRNRDGRMIPLGSVASVRTYRRTTDGDALQHVPRRRSHRQCRTRVQQRRKHRRAGTAGQPANCPTTMAAEWTELAFLGTHLRQHRHCCCSPVPWRSCSSCWPPSTKAGLCHSP
ncbi:MAG UNVERIFIED_CONTAM: efflux RND transporter permease subunit [Planctomycetaceae bacterium]